NGRKIRKRLGLRVAPKSSPLFQEFKIWQVLNNLQFRNKSTKEVFVPNQEVKQQLFDELNIKGNIPVREAIKLMGHKSKDWEGNYATLEGNRTAKLLYDAYLKILEVEGYDEDLLKLNGSDDIDVSKIAKPACEIKQMVQQIFGVLGIDIGILDFDAELDGKAFEEQVSYQLWHLLYSYEGDDSASGNEKLYELLNNKFGFKKQHAEILANIAFSDDYGNLSTKAMR